MILWIGTKHSDVNGWCTETDASFQTTVVGAPLQREAQDGNVGTRIDGVFKLSRFPGPRWPWAYSAVSADVTFLMAVQPCVWECRKAVQTECQPYMD